MGRKQCLKKTCFKKKKKKKKAITCLEPNILTSHAIVGEPLAELIHNNEEDADRVAKNLFTLRDRRINNSVQ